ncbi:MAG: response regulator [Spirochaetales bacterium]|nr:response regulator [Spirochaetales bacterium]
MSEKAGNWGIDLVGRKMRHQPWPINKEGKYQEPANNDREEIYGISGEAVNETLLYFEECGGSTERLIQLLNEHVIDTLFRIDREALLDKTRWYNNEYYFYFIMFTKKVMGDYDWRFTKGENVQLSVYHKIYEIGYLRFTPYGEEEKDDSNAIPNAVINYYTKKGYDFLDFLTWADAISKEKTSISYSETVSKLNNYWLCSEFNNFLYEFTKIILNMNNVKTICDECFDSFDLAGFSHVPESMLIKIQNFIHNKATKSYDINIKYNKNNSCDFTSTMSGKFNEKKNHNYKLSWIITANSIAVSAFPQIIKKILRLDELPVLENLAGWGTECLSFTLRWKKRILSIPYLQLIILNSILIVLVILNNVFKLNLFLNIAGIFAMLNLLLIFLRKLKIEKNKRKISDENFVKAIEDDSKRLEKLEELSNELILGKHNLEKKVQERTKELVCANQKLKEFDIAKTNFIANISHELRTPLTLILGPLEAMVSEEYGDTIRSNDEMLKIMLYNASKLLNLINKLLDYTKIEARRMTVNKKTIDVSKLLNFYVSTVKSSAMKRGLSIVFNNNTNENKIIAFVDRDLLEKAVFNLISNSLKFTTRDGQIIVQLDKDKDYFVISVKDTGIGIPEDKLDVIFERFTQLDASASRKYEGTGIGLALTKEIVEIMGGRIMVKSTLHEGSTFTIKLPYEREENSADKSEIEDIYEIKPDILTDFHIASEYPDNSFIRQEENKSQKESKKILVVEDNMDMQEFIKTILHKDYTIITAKNGKQGLEKAHEVKPDLILADVMMSGIDGYEMTEKIKSQLELRGIPVILLTAKADIFMKIEGFKKGADDYIIKPFNSKELKARINAHLQMKNLRDELARQKNEINIKKKELEEILKEKIIIQGQLEESEKRFREMAENLPVSIIEIDRHNRIIYLNHYGKKIFKATSEDLIRGIYVYDYCESGEKDKFIKNIQKIYKEKNLKINYYNFILKDGTKIKVLIKPLVLYEEKEITGIRLTILEIEPEFNITLLPDKNFYESYDISEREGEIITLLIKGLSYNQIGEKLFISYKTVDKHISNIYRKTKVNNRSQLMELVQQKS